MGVTFELISGYFLRQTVLTTGLAAAFAVCLTLLVAFLILEPIPRRELDE